MDASVKVEIGVTTMLFHSFLLHHADAVIFDFLGKLFSSATHPVLEFIQP